MLQWYKGWPDITRSGVHFFFKTFDFFRLYLPPHAHLSSDFNNVGCYFNEFTLFRTFLLSFKAWEALWTSFVAVNCVYNSVPQKATICWHQPNPLPEVVDPFNIKVKPCGRYFNIIGLTEAVPWYSCLIEKLISSAYWVMITLTVFSSGNAMYPGRKGKP